MSDAVDKMKIIIATSPFDIERCFPVMRQLRPHLSMEGFAGQVKRQMDFAGYRLVLCEADGAVMAAAGYRISEFLAWGKTLYVDDLITDESARGRGFGGILMDWLVGKAGESGCAEVHLDSGVHRFDAHRLYLNKRMNITAHHFAVRLA